MIHCDMNAQILCYRCIKGTVLCYLRKDTRNRDMHVKYVTFPVCYLQVSSLVLFTTDIRNTAISMKRVIIIAPIINI